MPRPAVYAMNLSPDRLRDLRLACMRLKLPLTAVSPEDFSQPVGALCGLAERVADPAAAPAFTDEMLLFAFMDASAVNRFLTAARQLRFAPVALKAILTPTNATWTVSQLHDELAKERASLSGVHGPQES